MAVAKPRIYVLPVPAGAGLILPMENDHSSTCNTTEQNLSSLAGDASFTSMTVQNFTLTVGTGRWVRSRPFQTGFYFDGSASYATKAGYQPFNALTKFSVEAWFVAPATQSTTRNLFGVYTGANNYVTMNIYSGNGKFYADVYNGVGKRTYSNGGFTLTEGHLYCCVMAWDKDADSGKLTTYLYDVDTATLTTITATDGMTDAISCADDLEVGRMNGTAYWLGVACKLAIYTAAKLTAAEAAQLYTRAQTVIYDETSVPMWEFAEQTGTTVYDTGWRRDGHRGRSIYQDGTGYLSVADDADLEVGASDFTVAVKVYIATAQNNNVLLNKTSAFTFYADVNSRARVRLYDTAWRDSYTGANVVTVGAWHSVVMGRESGVTKCYVDGVSVAIASDGMAGTTMASNANAWTSGPCSAGSRIELLLLHPSEWLGAQWAQDFHTGSKCSSFQKLRASGAPQTVTLAVSNKADCRSSLFTPNTTVLVSMGDDLLQYRFVFAGTVQSVSKGNPNVLTVLVEDYGRELADTFDDPYGRTTATMTTIDPKDAVDNLLPSGFTNTMTSALARQDLTFTTGTSRRAALERVAQLSGFQWRIDAWKKLWAKTMARTPIAETCEATTNWSTDVGAIATDAVTFKVGTKSVYTNNAGASYIRYTPTAVINIEQYKLIGVWIYDLVQGDNQIVLYTGAAFNAANYYSMNILPLSTAGVSKWTFVLIHVPDAEDDHGWTAAGSADYTAKVNTIEIQGGADNPISDLRIDDLRFMAVSDPVPAKAYTTAQFTGLDLTLSRDAHLRYAIMSSAAAGSPHTAQIDVHGDWGSRELVCNDANCDDDAEAFFYAITQFLAQGMGYPVVNVVAPWTTDILDLQPGDSVRVTDAGLGLADVYTVDSVTFSLDGQGSEASISLGVTNLVIGPRFGTKAISGNLTGVNVRRKFTGVTDTLV